ncbi:MAG: hypothetical protein CMJ58_16755 [Planctomycetaceae bacterium]|nr:hypothetical protein [Planctomycetaceae bacterium]
MSSYTQSLQRHLAAYKASRLGVKESGTFVRNGRERHYAHILPKELRWLNVLEQIRTEVREYLELHPEVKSHKYFHHLNSSQAFAINLFFPYFEQGAPSALLQAMGLSGEFAGWQPEHIADISEGTNVDVMWHAPSGAKTYCEVKLSEQEFGVARDDRRHRQKLDEIYKPVLFGQCAPELLEPRIFFAHYQLLRNVWLAAREPDASVVFLAPRANTALWSQLNPFIKQLAPSLRRRVHAVAIEDVLAQLVSSQKVPPQLAWYALLLQEKYVVSSAAG